MGVQSSKGLSALLALMLVTLSLPLLVILKLKAQTRREVDNRGYSLQDFMKALR